MVKAITLGRVEHEEKNIFDIADTIWGYAELGPMESRSSKLRKIACKNHKTQF